MKWITSQALAWSLKELRIWADSEQIGPRFKQVVYRLFLLRQLGVSSNTKTQLSTGDFRKHCRRFLLVADEESKEFDDGQARYLVPTTCKYQKASGGSSTDWAVGTMWTRCQTWKENGILDFEPVEGTQGQRSLLFTPKACDIFFENLEHCKIPALALAIFLLRNPKISHISLASVTDADSLLVTFFNAFNLNENSLQRLMSLESDSAPKAIVSTEPIPQDVALRFILNEIPYTRDRVLEGYSMFNSATRSYRLGKKERKGLSEKPVQLLVHGCPGSGKSYLLQQWAIELSKSITVVFHPETSYADFVGVYRPTPVYRGEDENFRDEAGQIRLHGEPYITYNFVPGPLLDAYCYAVQNPDQSVVLIIEELSRANASLVFGDMLQLLDRLDTDEGKRKSGESAYEITPKPEVSAYLRSYGIDGGRRGKIRLPNNLHVWATMNRSDQHARQLDSAFLRRWKKKYISYTAACEYGNETVKVPGGECKWDQLRHKINQKLVTLVPEDKFVGPYFLSKHTLGEPEAVADDLLGYLWNDVLKSRTREFFSPVTFSTVREMWIEGKENPFLTIDLP